MVYPTSHWGVEPRHLDSISPAVLGSEAHSCPGLFVRGAARSLSAVPCQLKPPGWEVLGIKCMELYKTQQSGSDHTEGQTEAQTIPPQSNLGENTQCLPGALTLLSY